MVRITEDLVRKKAEHNECLIGTLEEIALHQEDIDQIENIQHWAKGLKILLLQNNLISKIENLHKLKNLEYLNLAINNIEKIENLEGLESLQKLDLTLNFVGELTGLETLRGNYNLEILYMTGNPCTDFEHYRTYAIATLPQLKILDGVDILPSDRIKALQKLRDVRPLIIQQQIEYRSTREKQVHRVTNKIRENWESGGNEITDEDRTSRFWKSTCEYSPEIRNEISKVSRSSRNKDVFKKDETTKPQLKLFANDGRPYCMNQPKLKFEFIDKGDHWVLDLAIYKHMDTSLVDVDVQVNYVRVTVKNKIFQMALPEEVNISKSVAQRSQITGHLVISLPKMNADEYIRKKKPFTNLYDDEDEKPSSSLHAGMSRREYLEIGGGPDDMDFSKIFERSKDPKQKPEKKVVPSKEPIDFDESEVPPLE